MSTQRKKPRKKVKSGEPYELLTKKLAELLAESPLYEIEHDVKLPGADTDRQFDVVVRTKVVGRDILTVFECKDWNKRVDIKVVDGLRSKMADVKANAGVLVSRNGFTQSAIDSAKRTGITLWEVDDADGLARKLGVPPLLSIVEVIPRRMSETPQSAPVLPEPKRGRIHVDAPTMAYVNEKIRSEFETVMASDGDVTSLVAGKHKRHYDASTLEPRTMTFTTDDGDVHVFPTTRLLLDVEFDLILRHGKPVLPTAISNRVVEANGPITTLHFSAHDGSDPTAAMKEWMRAAADSIPRVDRLPSASGPILLLTHVAVIIP